jgi:hypothetical protein
MAIKSKLFNIIISLFFALSCASTKRNNQEISENNLDFIKGKTVSVVILHDEGKSLPATPMLIGPSGLLDLLIIGPSNDIKTALSKHKFSSFFKSIYVPQLKDYAKKFGFQLNPSVLVTNEAKVAKNENSSEREFRLTFKGRFPASKSQLILVIKPYQFGAVRKVFSFIPLSGYEGHVNFSTTLINAENNNVIAHYDSEFQVRPRGDWDQPPAFTGLVDSIKTAFQKTSQTNLDMMFPYE